MQIYARLERPDFLENDYSNNNFALSAKSFTAMANKIIPNTF